MRLDKYLVERGFFESRTKAQDAISAGAVLVSDKVITKPNYEVKEDAFIHITKEICPYVSRGGLKLKKAIDEFRLSFKDKVILDIGASTGGFTDCSLQEGASFVYAVDVGKDQLSKHLKEDKRVLSLEQTNILDIKAFDKKIDFIVMDVSFVSIVNILPAINYFLREDMGFICLIKPQFEVGKMYLKNGVVKDKGLHLRVLEKVSHELEDYGMGIYKLIPSPILGGSGNKEFLAYIKRGICCNINFLEVVKE